MISDKDLSTVDVGIRDQIIQFNLMGFETWACCSGHVYDPHSDPYVAFLYYDERIEVCAKLCGLDFVRFQKGERPWEMTLYGNEYEIEMFPDKLNNMIYLLKKIEMYDMKIAVEKDMEEWRHEEIADYSYFSDGLKEQEETL